MKKILLIVTILSLSLSLTAWAGIDFNGSDDRLQVPDSSDFSFGDGSDDSPFSVSCWFKFTASSAAQALIAKYYSASREWYVYINSAEQLMFLCYDEVNNKYIARRYTAILDAATWYQVVCTYDGTSASSGMNIYLNGVVVDDLSVDNLPYTAMSDVTTPLTIGSAQAQSFYDGEITEVAVWDVELSATEAAILGKSKVKRMPLQIRPSNLVAYYPMDDHTSSGSLSRFISDANCMGAWAMTGWDVSTNQVAHYYMNDDAADTHVDDNEETYDGTLDGGDNTQDLSVAGKINEAFNFNGTDDEVDCNFAADAAGGPSEKSAYSISAWINSDVADSNKGIVAFWDGTDGIILQTTSGGGEGILVMVGLGTDFANVNVQIDDDWHHLVLVYDGSLTGNANRLKLYYDGSVQTLTFGGSANIPATIPASSAEAKIGEVGTLGRNFDGLIDDVRFFDEALTQAKIDGLYLADTGTELNEGFELDLSGEGETLTETGGTIPTDAHCIVGATSRDFELGDTEWLAHADGGSTDISGADQAITVCAWIWLETSTINSGVVTKYDSNTDDMQYMLYVSTGNIPTFLVSNDGSANKAATSALIGDGHWYHIAGVYNDTDIRCYTDGVVGTPVAATTGIYDGTEEFQIGNFTGVGGVTRSFDGLIDDVMVFDRELSATEIYEIYEEGRIEYKDMSSNKHHGKFMWKAGPNGIKTPETVLSYP